MDGKEFVANWVALKAELLDTYTAEDGVSDIAAKVRAMDLSAEQQAQMRGVLDGVLRDTMVTLLMGLDGAASIGNCQQTFTITDEEGNVIHDIEDAAWEGFHGEGGR